jgi:hypothetical protein
MQNRYIENIFITETRPGRFVAEHPVYGELFEFDEESANGCLSRLRIDMASQVARPIPSTPVPAEFYSRHAVILFAALQCQFLEDMGI